MRVILKKEDIKNTYRKFGDDREEKIFDELVDFAIERKMTASEVDSIFRLVARSISDAAEAACKDVGF